MAAHSARTRRLRVQVALGRDIFCLKNFDTFARTPVHESKMNYVACAQLTFQIVNFTNVIILCYTVPQIPGSCHRQISAIPASMMTSSNGNIFRVTGPLCGKFTGPGEFPTQAGDWGRQRGHYDVNAFSALLVLCAGNPLVTSGFLL